AVLIEDVNELELINWEDSKTRRPHKEWKNFPPETNPATIQYLCQGIQQTCTGNNEQYESFEDCVDFMTHKIPYGSSDRLDQDSVSCRILHIQLAALAPVVHCPHCGPTGGGACTNKTSQSYYEVDYLSCAYKRKTHCS
ncbi:unnamed protein product, partial [Didymodactylos carnosus]